MKLLYHKEYVLSLFYPTWMHQNVDIIKNL